MAVLARYHIHLDLSLDEKIKVEGREYILSLIKEASSTVFDQQVTVNIEYRDGSIHYFIEVAGVLFTGIAAYGAIRSFIDYSIKDSKNLRNIIKNKLLKRGLPEDHLIEFRKLEGSTDRIRRLILHIDRLEKGLSIYTYEEMRKELVGISKKLDLLSYELNDYDFSVVIKSIRSRNIKQLDELYRDIKSDVSFGKKEDVFFPFN